MLTALVAGQAAAQELSSVSVKVPAKTDVPLDAESVEALRNGSRNGGMTEGAAVQSSEDERFSLYQSSFEVLFHDQWRATLKRYGAIKEIDDSGVPVMRIVKRGDLADHLLANVRSGYDRTIKYWSFDDRGFKILDGSNADGEFDELTQLSRYIRAASGDETREWDASAASMSAPQAFLAWMQGWDFSYANAEAKSPDVLFERTHMLSDIGQSGIVLNGPPEIYDSLPGYKQWASSKSDRDTYLYVQTNDGILHVIKPAATNLTEHAALLLPPSLLPGRLAALKTDERGAWIDVSGDQSSSEPYSVRSRPVYALDGPLQLRHFNMRNTDDPDHWRTYLIGTLGRAGNGIYMMDADDPSDPKLMWYRENITIYRDAENADVTTITWNSTSTRDSVASETKQVRWGFGNAEINNDDPDWMWLGFNSPEPAPTVVGTPQKKGTTNELDLRNIIVLGGGMKGNARFAGSNGIIRYPDMEGSAIFILDAETGDILRMFNSVSRYANDSSKATIGSATLYPKMGMIVSKPTLFRTKESRYIANSAFLASLNGGVYMISFGKKDGAESSAEPSDWRIAYLATLVIPVLDNDTGGGGNFAVPHGLAITRAPGSADPDDIWVAGATADVFSRTDMGGVGLIPNDLQMIFAFTTSVDPEKADFTNFLKWQSLDKMKDDDGFERGTTVEIMEGWDSEAEDGWYTQLDKESSSFEREYSSARPLIIDGVLLVPTFLQGKGSGESKSRLYALDISTGAAAEGIWDENGRVDARKFKELGGVKITGLSLSTEDGRRTVIATYDRVDSDKSKLSSALDSEDKLNAVDGAGEEIDAFTIDFGEIKSTKRFKNASSIIDYWLEK